MIYVFLNNSQIPYSLRCIFLWSFLTFKMLSNKIGKNWNDLLLSNSKCSLFVEGPDIILHKYANPKKEKNIFFSKLHKYTMLCRGLRISTVNMYLQNSTILAVFNRIEINLFFVVVIFLSYNSSDLYNERSNSICSLVVDRALTFLHKYANVEA